MRPVAWFRSQARWQRRVAAVVLCLMIGAAATLAGAWAPPVVTSYRRGSGVQYYAPFRALLLRDEAGREFQAIQTRGLFSTSWTIDSRDWQVAPGAAPPASPPPGEKPSWVPWPAPGVSEGMGVVAYGFPLPAMCYVTPRHNSVDWSLSPPKIATTVEWQDVRSIQVGSKASQIAFVPLRPLWVGFAVDVLIFALLAWTLLFGLRDARAFMRNRSGRCAACGYDLRGGVPGVWGVCPECGGVRGGG